MVRGVTTALIVGGFGLMLWIGLMLPQRPLATEPLAVRRAFAVRLLSATGGVLLCLVGAGVGASLVSRQAKREYREASLRNLRTLVEGEDPPERRP